MLWRCATCPVGAQRLLLYRVARRRFASSLISRTSLPAAALSGASRLMNRLIVDEVGLLTQAEFDQDLARLDDPRTLFPSPVMWTACGRRPQGSQWPTA